MSGSDLTIAIVGAVGLSALVGALGLGAARWARARGRRPWAWIAIAIGAYAALALVWEAVRGYVR